MPKKTVSAIVERGGEYCIGLKENQPGLYAAAAALSEDKVISRHESSESKSGRQTTRRVSCFGAPDEFRLQWSGLRSIVRVERSGMRDNKTAYTETSYYISSLELDAERIGEIVRSHWRIENCLHWQKDVAFGEDDCPIRNETAAANMSLIRSLVMNIIGKEYKGKFKKAQRFLANKIMRIRSLIE